MDLDSLKRKADLLSSELSHTHRTVEEEQGELETSEALLKDAIEARDLIQRVGQAVQQTAHDRIASVVTRCLKSVFGEDAYTFSIRFERKRGRTEAMLVLERDGLILEDPANEGGGGVVDVAAFALRVACLLLSRPRLRRLIVADEPMKNVNGEVYQSRVGEMLLTLGRELGVQMVIVSDDDWLKIGKVVEL
jgi:hypothetical protein